MHGSNIVVSAILLSVDTKAQKQLEALIDTRQLGWRNLSKESSDAALVNRSKVIDERIRRFREATRTCAKTGYSAPLPAVP